MAEPPRPPLVIDTPSDGDALIRLAMTPPPAQRKNRHFSMHTPAGSSHSSTSLPSEPILSPEEQLINTLAAIEGDEMSYDVFQFVIEMVRSPLDGTKFSELGNLLVSSFLRLHFCFVASQ